MVTVEVISFGVIFAFVGFLLIQFIASLSCFASHVSLPKKLSRSVAGSLARVSVLMVCGVARCAGLAGGSHVCWVVSPQFPVVNTADGDR